MNHFPLLARFNGWVNDRLYGAVATLPEADYRADGGLFFGSIHRTLNHLLVVDRLWTGRIAGADRGIRSLDQIPYDDFASLRAARRDEDAHLIDFVDGLDEARLGEVVRYRRMIGEGEEEARAGHILLTLFNHQTHHRGQVTAMLTRLGVEYPALDVVYYLEEIGACGPPGTVGGKA